MCFCFAWVMGVIGGRAFVGAARWGALVAVVAAVSVSGVGAAGAASAGPCGRLASQPPQINHLVVIVMENHSAGQVIGPAPYLSSLARQCGLATNSWAVSHPSLPNYLALTSGTTLGIGVDCDPSRCARWSPNVFSQLRAAHQSWRAFNESMPTPCDLTSGSLYDAQHNPATYYLNLRTSCLHHDLPLGTPRQGPFAHALHHGLAGLTMITPNVCSDMHSCPVSVGDRWLATWIGAITQSPAYQRGHTAVIITFDEGTTTNRVATVVVSPYTPPATRSSVYYTHYSLLRTEESLLHLPLLGAAHSAATLIPAFHL